MSRLFAGAFVVVSVYALVTALVLGVAHLLWNLFLAPLFGWTVLPWWEPGLVWIVGINLLRLVTKSIADAWKGQEPR